jgi:hypothetical protein
MKLVICLDCEKIIGCGLTEASTVKNQCIICTQKEECREATPVGYFVQRVVLFVRLPYKCSDHERPTIGFKVGGKECL